MKGRIPNWIKEYAKEQVDEYGGMAIHFAIYNTDWSNLDVEDLRLISAIDKLLKERGIL